MMDHKTEKHLLKNKYLVKLSHPSVRYRKELFILEKEVQCHFCVQYGRWQEAATGTRGDMV
jgi:hypothetical protein